MTRIVVLLALCVSGCTVARGLVDWLPPDLPDSSVSECDVPLCESDDADTGELGFEPTPFAGHVQKRCPPSGADTDAGVLDAGDLSPQDAAISDADTPDAGAPDAAMPSAPGAEVLDATVAIDGSAPERPLADGGDAGDHSPSALVPCAPRRLAQSGTNILLQDEHLLVASEVPATFTLSHATLREVDITLSGPVTLEIDQESFLQRVRVVGSASTKLQAAAAPRLVLRDSELASSTVEFAGTFDLLGSMLRESRLDVSDLNMTSVIADRAWLSAERFSGADLELSQATVAADYASLAATRLHGVDIKVCGAWTLTRSSVVSSRIAACSVPPLRVYDSDVLKSEVNGAIESDDSRWNATRFGLNAASELLAWHSVVRGSAFCAGTTRVRFGAGGVTSCLSCAEPPATTPEICAASDGVTELLPNLCSAFETTPRCREDLPRRMRPGSYGDE